MRFLTYSAAVLAGFLISASAEATSFLMMDQNQVIESSKAVCFGTIESVGSQSIPTQARAKTISTFKIQECLKGALSGTVKIIAPGGSMEVTKNGKTEKIVQKVPGAPQFVKGWTGVVHLWWPNNSKTDELQVTSWQRGLMRMTYDAEIKDFREGDILSQSARKESSTKPQKKYQRPATRPAEMTLKAYREKVRELSQP
jgi:hypothetical protein